MTNTPFEPVLFLKKNCPFCLKVRIFVLEAGLQSGVSIRDFASGTAEEAEARATLTPHLEKVSFPAAQVGPDRFLAESDDIIAFLEERSGRKRSDFPVYQNYTDGVLNMAMGLWKENQELKKAASAP